MVYNSKIHETLKQFEASGAPAKLQVIRQDDSIKMGTYSQVNPAFPGDIDFPLNSQLRDRIKEESTCRVITIAELRKIDARENRESFTVRGIVSLGEEEMEDLETTWGLKKIKRDIVMQDESGSIEFHVFANRLKELKDGKTYEITAMTLSDIRGIHLGLSRESCIKEIAPMKGLPEAAKITPSTKQFDVVGFDSVSREKIFFYCKCCKKEVLITEKTVPTWITCTNIKCNTDLRTTALKRHASCDVNFQIGDGADMWATMFPNILEKIIEGEVQSTAQVNAAVKSIEWCTVIVNKNVIVDILFPEKVLGQEDRLDSSGKTQDGGSEKGEHLDLAGNSQVSEDASGKTQVLEEGRSEMEESQVSAGNGQVSENAGGKTQLTEDGRSEKEEHLDAAGKGQVSEDASGKTQVPEDGGSEKEEHLESTGKRRGTGKRTGKRTGKSEVPEEGFGDGSWNTQVVYK